MTDIIEQLRAYTHPNAHTTEIAPMLNEAADEIERLRELFGIDGEQHAIHVREIEARHEIRHKHYCAEIERLHAEVEALRAITQMPLDDYVEQLRRRLEAAEAALANVAGIMHRFKE